MSHTGHGGGWKLSKVSLLCVHPSHILLRPLRLQGAPAPRPTPSSPLSGVCREPGWPGLLLLTVERTEYYRSLPRSKFLLPHLAVARTPGAPLKCRRGKWGGAQEPRDSRGSPSIGRHPPQPQELGCGWGGELFPLPPLCHRRGESRCGRRCAGGARRRAARPYLAISAPPGKPRPRQSCPRPPPALSHPPGGRRK